MSRKGSAESNRHPAIGAVLTAVRFVATVATICAMCVAVVPAGMVGMIGWAIGSLYLAIQESRRV